MVAMNAEERDWQRTDKLFLVQIAPATIPSYTEQEWHGGAVYVEEQVPSILFAKDGEVYDLNGMQTIAIGGAYSIDWMLRTPGRSWWPDEQPSDEVKGQVEKKLDQLGWQVDVVLSHQKTFGDRA